MAVALNSLGFKVVSKINVNKKEMRDAINQFGIEIRAGGVGLFYYAGHGIQSGGRNYLIPVNADIQSKGDVEDEAVSVDQVLSRMGDARNRMNIVILDACRNNPFSSFRSASRGLTQLVAPSGTFIAYATAPGSVAEDGDGTNGIYTQALLKEIQVPGAQLEDVFKNVLSAVKNQTGGNQVPWISSSVEGQLYFARVDTDGQVEHADLPNKPKTKSFSLSDLDAAAEREDEVKNAWSSTLKQMQTAYADLLSYEKRDVSGNLKATAWRRFIAAYGDDDPYSSNDDDMRFKAQARVSYWDSEKTPRASKLTKTKPHVASSINNSLGMEFVLVQSGTFQMGSSDGASNEAPVHAVTISQPFYIGKYEVTQSQWQAIMGNNPSYFKDANRPVEMVSWSQAQEFIRTLNQKENTSKYSLPTEAQWEFAACGGNQSRKFRFAGSNHLSEVAISNVSQTSAVGSLKPNELGLYDMSGNVCEWCSDWYGAYSAASVQDPVGPGFGPYHVLRGGNYGGINDNDYWRPVYRRQWPAGDSYADSGTGLRVVVRQE